MQKRLILASAATAALILGPTTAAFASTSGGEPQPSGQPTSSYTPPPSYHHQKPHQHEVCFFSLETETDHISVQGGQSYGEPTGQPQGGYNGQAPVTDSYSAPKGVQPNESQETIHVVQLVRVCVEGNKVTVTDESQPYGWEQQGNGGPMPTPYGLPNSIGSLLTQ
jgi:hypothetical protein